MNDIWAGLSSAFWLVVTGDPDLIEITLRSLQVSLTALVIASAIALPFGTWLAIRRFRFRRTAIAVLNSLMGLPPVVVGLIVYLLLSRSGPFGVLGLLFAELGLWGTRHQPAEYASMARLDPKMFLVTFVVALAASLAAGLLPSWRASGVAPASQIKAG